MAYISQVKIGNATYDIKDAGARELIAALGDAVYWIGVTTTELVDDVTTSAVITVGGESVTAKIGGMAQYNGEEFVYNGTKWQSIGKNNFGDLAFASSVDVTASGSFTPEGSVSLTTTAASIASGVTPTTATIKEFDDAGSVTAGSAASFTQGSDSFTQGTDVFTAEVTNEVLELGFVQGTDSFTQGSDNFTANVPTAVSLPTSKNTSVVTDVTATEGSIDVPTSASFTGTAGSVSVTGSGLPHAQS